MKRLLAIRKKIQKRRNFHSKKGHWKKCTESSWRAPRGIHNKQKIGKKGKGQVPSTGYRSPVEVRGTLFNGLAPVLVRNLKEVKGIAKDSVAVLSGKLGKRRREEIRQKAQEIGVKVAN